MKKGILFTAAWLVAALSVTHVVAARMYSEDIVYFSDPEMTDLVGEEIIGCYGTPWLTGIQTPYHKYVYQDPCRETSGECSPNQFGC